MKITRFLYINVFAFLLIGLSVLIYLTPLDIFMKVLKFLCALWAVVGGISIISSWKAKSKKIKLLAARNMKEIRPDTFKQIKQTLCGQLMVNLVLSDLRKTENYKTLSKKEWKELRHKAFGVKSKARRASGHKHRRCFRQSSHE